MSTEYRFSGKSHDSPHRHRKSIYQNPILFFFMTNTLQLGIDENFLNLLKGTYKKSTANIMLNGKKIEALPVRQGTK